MMIVMMNNRAHSVAAVAVLVAAGITFVVPNLVDGAQGDWNITNDDIQREMSYSKQTDCIIPEKGREKTIYLAGEVIGDVSLEGNPTDNLKVPSRLDPNLLLSENEIKKEWNSYPELYKGDCYYESGITPHEIRARAQLTYCTIFDTMKECQETQKLLEPDPE